MKSSTLTLKILVLGFMLIPLLASSCKKDNEDSEPQPTNPKNYIGSTEQDLPVSFGTAEIEGILYLISYSIELVYHDTVHGTMHQANLSQSISSGIVPFTGDSLHFTTNELILNGGFQSGDAHLTGDYSWKYDGTNTYSGAYFAVKQ